MNDIVLKENRENINGLRKTVAYLFQQIVEAEKAIKTGSPEKARKILTECIEDTENLYF